jgi:low temperature requirement protein LtrA
MRLGIVCNQEELLDDEVIVEAVDALPLESQPVTKKTPSHAAEWLELFFDLAFVIVVHRIAVPLESQPLTAGRTLRFSLRIFCVWWVWHSVREKFDLRLMRLSWYSLLSSLLFLRR